MYTYFSTILFISKFPFKYLKVQKRWSLCVIKTISSLCSSEQDTNQQLQIQIYVYGMGLGYFWDHLSLISSAHPIRSSRCYRFCHLGSYLQHVLDSWPSLWWHPHYELFCPQGQVILISFELLKVLQDLVVSAGLGTLGDRRASEVAPLLLTSCHLLFTFVQFFIQFLMF